MEYFLAVFGVCLVFALVIQWKLLKRSEITSHSHLEIIEEILAMKTWLAREEALLPELRNHPDFKGLESVEGPRDLIQRDILFGHLEKLYHAVQSAELSDQVVEGFAREIELWLRSPGMKLFFGEFCWKQRNHSAAFLAGVRKFYENEQKGFSFEPDGSNNEDPPSSTSGREKVVDEKAR